MDAIEKFYQAVSDTLTQVMDHQRANITTAAGWMADSVEAGKIFHVFGTGGHSNMAAIEMNHRAGNLVPANCILDPGLSCEHGATRWCEKIPGYAQQVLRYYRVQPGDLMLQVNAYGINAVTIDTAMECRRLGVKTIAITSPSLSRQIPADTPARHPSGQNLCDLADLVIDSYTPYGEAMVDLPNVAFKVSPASSIINLFILDAMNAKACEILNQRGITPPVWISGNIPGGNEANQQNLDAYWGRLRHL
ncbi:MAG: sugar isomerase domain-containing protein [Clostridia bacterium]|nr:sugar isomerase domain-containing protein [Clostridia bacterium]